MGPHVSKGWQLIRHPQYNMSIHKHTYTHTHIWLLPHFASLFLSLPPWIGRQWTCLIKRRTDIWTGNLWTVGRETESGEGKGGSGICFTPFKECSITHMPVCPGAYLMEWKSIDARVPHTSFSFCFHPTLNGWQSFSPCRRKSKTLLLSRLLH